MILERDTEGKNVANKEFSETTSSSILIVEFQADAKL